MELLKKIRKIEEEIEKYREKVNKEIKEKEEKIKEKYEKEIEKYRKMLLKKIEEGIEVKKIEKGKAKIRKKVINKVVGDFFNDYWR